MSVCVIERVGGWMGVCVRVCVCVAAYVCLCVCVCVPESEREGERERGRVQGGDCQREGGWWGITPFPHTLVPYPPFDSSRSAPAESGNTTPCRMT